MNYQKIHDNIIERAQNRPIPESYTEKHHIIPRCVNGSDEELNLVRLTPEEHFVIHQLLVKIYPDNYHLVLAVNIMSGGSKHHRDYRTNNKLYGWLRRRLYKHIQFDCLNCGKVNSKCISREAKFCNRRCWSQYMRKNSSTSVTCPQCLTPFNVGSYKATKRKYCSKQCQFDAIRTNYLLQYTCQECGLEFDYKICRPGVGGKFCSEECRKKSCKIIEHFCKQCGESFWHKYDPCRLKIFCSPNCGAKYRKLHGRQFR